MSTHRLIRIRAANTEASCLLSTGQKCDKELTAKMQEVLN